MRRFCAKALSVAVILSYGFLGPIALAARFVDLDGYWAEKYINQLSDEGVIAAENDGKFKPDEPVTRAVLSYWLVKVLGLDTQSPPATPTFADVKPSDWFYGAVETIAQNRYIAGYADGFRPNQQIQRAEVIAIIARTLKQSPPDSSAITQALSKYKDGSKVPDWARIGVAEAAQAKILVNHPDPDLINAASIAKRGDTASLMYELDQYVTQQKITQAEQDARNGGSSKSRASGPGQAMAQDYSGGQTTTTPQQSYAAPPPQNYSAPPPQNYAIPAQAYAPQQQPPQGYPPNYQGQVQQGYPPQYGAPPGGGYPPPGAGYGQPGAYPAQGGYAQGGYAQGGYPPQGGGYQYGNAGYPSLQGRVAVVAAGTQFQANLINSLDSETTQPGEEVRATLGSPLSSNGIEVVPAGSKVLGQVTNVVSAKRFKFGANGKIDIRFTQVQTPDGRTFPLSASVNTNQLSLSGGTTKGRVGKSLLYTGGGALGGAALGTGLGAIVGGMSHGRMGMATGMGAVFGTAMGAGVGVVGAGVRKGSEIKIPAGTSLPIQLDESFQITAGGPPPVQQPYYGGGGGGYPPPVQQPVGGAYYPQQ